MSNTNHMEGISHFGATSKVRKAYMRNNKSGGVKHLRCFPHCLEHGHVANGFCGAPLFADLVMVKEEVTKYEYLAVAQFITQVKVDPVKITAAASSGNKTGTTRRAAAAAAKKAKANAAAAKVLAEAFSPIEGQEYSIDYIRSRTNSRAKPLSPLYGSSVASEPWNGNNAHYIFKFEPSSWNYAWRSNKHRQNMLHVCRTYLFRVTKSSGQKKISTDSDDESANDNDTPTSSTTSSAMSYVDKVMYVTHCDTEPFTVSGSKLIEAQGQASFQDKLNRSRFIVAQDGAGDLNRKRFRTHGLLLANPSSGSDIASSAEDQISSQGSCSDSEQESNQGDSSTSSGHDSGENSNRSKKSTSNPSSSSSSSSTDMLLSNIPKSSSISSDGGEADNEGGGNTLGRSTGNTSDSGNSDNGVMSSASSRSPSRGEEEEGEREKSTTSTSSSTKAGIVAIDAVSSTTQKQFLSTATNSNTPPSALPIVGIGMDSSNGGNVTGSTSPADNSSGSGSDSSGRSKGSNICVHGRRRYTCKKCGGKGICSHGRQRYQCKDCGGGGICRHARIRSQCKDCGGGSICQHKRIRSVCKDCGGGSICQHKRIRSKCKECRTSSASESEGTGKKRRSATRSKKASGCSTSGESSGMSGSEDSTTFGTSAARGASSSSSSSQQPKKKRQRKSARSTSSSSDTTATEEANIQPKVSTTVQGSMVVVKKKPAATRKAKAKKNIKRQVPKHQPIATHPNFKTADIRRAVSKNHLQVRVLTTAGPFYVRNNKRGGLKNLRCFPRCLDKGHNRNGFCGRPLNVELQISAREFRKSQFVAYGRFTLADPTGQDNGSIISQFKTYRSLDIMNMTKTKDDNSMPLYKSTPSTNTAGKSHGAIVFRFSPTSWHYGWRSSKHMKDSAHVFRVFCFIVSPDRKLLKCVAVTETSWFTLASSKRAKSTKDDAKKLAAKKNAVPTGPVGHTMSLVPRGPNVPSFSFSNDSLSLLAKLSRQPSQNNGYNNQSSRAHLQNSNVSFDGSFLQTDALSQPNLQSMQSLHSLQSLQSLHSLDFHDLAGRSNSNQQQALRNLVLPMDMQYGGAGAGGASSSSSSSSMSGLGRVQHLRQSSVESKSMDIVNDPTGFAAQMAGFLPTGPNGLPQGTSLGQSLPPSTGLSTGLSFGTGLGLMSNPSNSSYGGQLSMSSTAMSQQTEDSVKAQLQMLQAQLQQSQLQLLHAVKLNQYHEMVRSRQMLSNHQQVASFSSTSTMSNKRPAPSDSLAGGGGSNKRPRVNMGMGGVVSPAPQPTAQLIQTIPEQANVFKNAFPNLPLE